MFEEVVSQEVMDIVEGLSAHLSDFYLAGGTGLALQLRHRKSIDFDFFSSKAFDAEHLVKKIHPDKWSIIRSETLHCEKQGVKLSFFHYDAPLVYQLIEWRSVHVADWRDIAAEKMKALSQRGSKKDFFDVYVVIKLRIPINALCDVFKKRFRTTGINFYHVLKSLVFFDDAETEPEPQMLVSGKGWNWEDVKSFFEENVREFEKGLLG